MSRELLTLFREDDALRHAFDVVSRERRIRFGELLDSLDLSKETALEKLHQLEKESLIKSAFQNRCLWCADRYEHTRNRAISTENRTHLACDATPPTRF